MKKGIVIAHNNGLGDLIVMNGCVRWLASKYDTVYLTCFNTRQKHYEFMYRDDDNIKLIVKRRPRNGRQARLRQNAAFKTTVEENPDVTWEFRRCYLASFEEWRKALNKFDLKESETTWPELFYKVMHVPHSCRYTHFHMIRDYQAESELINRLNLPERYAFCVNDTRKYRYGLTFNTELPVINPMSFPFWKSTLLFDWMGVIERATEIHTVDTSWMHLTRLLQLKVPKFYYATRELILNGERYLNDHYDEGWIRVYPEGVKETQKDKYHLG